MSPKVMHLGLAEEPSGLYTQVSKGSYLRPIQWITAGFLVGLERNGQRVPLLAEEVPARDRGTWVLNPDGTMVTTWKLRKNSTWHDGVPVVAKDFVLGWQATIDRDIPAQYPGVARLISAMDTPDDHTLVMKWVGQSPFGDSLARDELQPLPAHLHEDLYRTNKARFVEGPHWTTEFVGAGPYSVSRWNTGVGMVLLAHDGYGPGRAKIDRINVQFVPDQNALAAGILAGTIDVTEQILSVSIANNLARGWANKAVGRNVVFAPVIQRYAEFQYRDIPGGQLALRDRNVRKALMHAIDRQALVDTVWEGRALVAHVFLARTDPAYPAVDAAAVKYDFDPSRATAALSEAGWQRGPDGRVRRGAAEVLSVPVQGGMTTDIVDTGAVMIAYWKEIGIDAGFTAVDEVAQRDSRLYTAFPGMNLTAAVTADNNLRWTTEYLPTEENRYRGSNRGSYANPTTDDLAARVQRTLDPREREQLLVELFRIWTDDVAIASLYYRPEIFVVGKGIRGYDDEVWPTQRTFTWNVHQWDIP